MEDHDAAIFKAALVKISVHILTNTLELSVEESSHQKAMEPALNALSNDSGNVELAVAVARMHLTEQDWENASAVLESFPVTANSNSTFLQVKGQSLLRANKIEAATNSNNFAIR